VVAATVAAPVPTAVDQAAVVEIPDDDALPPGWGQWENWPAPSLEPAVGVLVMQEDGCVIPRRPTQCRGLVVTYRPPHHGAPRAGALQRATGLL
jgi:hypothetical protein